MSDPKTAKIHPAVVRQHRMFAHMRRVSDDRLNHAIAGAERRFKGFPAGSRAAGNLACLAWDLRGVRADRAQARSGQQPISGRPGHAGFDRFCDIAASWGYP
jgi:hypothetical protein